MGDRANIHMIGGGNDLYFYTHWGGSELPKTLQAAMKRGKGRWTDTQYLPRIIFSEMIKDEVLEETGFGISSIVGDGEDRIIHVDQDSQTIKIGENVWTFDTFHLVGFDTIDWTHLLEPIE